MSTTNDRAAVGVVPPLSHSGEVEPYSERLAATNGVRQSLEAPQAASDYLQPAPAEQPPTPFGEAVTPTTEQPPIRIPWRSLCMAIGAQLAITIAILAQWVSPIIGMTVTGAQLVCGLVLVVAEYFSLNGK